MAVRRTDREREIDAEIAEYETIKATSKGDTAKIKALEAISRLRQERERIRSIRLAEGESDEVAKIDRYRRIALREGSYGPAAKLLELANSLRTQLAASEAERAAAEMTDLSVEELVGIIVSAIEEIPLEYVGVIAEAVGERLGEEAMAADYAEAYPVPAEG
ncbi:MAG: hypothetical protein H6733_10145 [Alphaproteobacteria bacterium]|nr:hypothetical protein [Alphaproteobacteria bacterium]